MKNKLLIIFSSILAGLTGLTVWMMYTWRHITFDELVFYLSNSIEGASNELFVEGALALFVPLITVLVICKIFVKQNQKSTIPTIVLCFSLLFCISAVVIACSRLKFLDYMLSNYQDSQYIANNYVDANSVKIKFPEKKKNLIYIYLESMESTYASKDV